MILPIVAYGHPVLRQVCNDIDANYPDLQKLIDDMWETMYNSHGMGLAAPQINKAIRMFVIDTIQVYEKTEQEDMEQFAGEQGMKKVFINARITSLNGTPWSCEEGCLSLPGFREEVSRESTVTIEYVNENFEPIAETHKGLNARVILHEYDHIDGKLFIDRIPPFRKKLLKKKLDDIIDGRVKAGYKMVFFK
jgi:peptide deformylase